MSARTRAKECFQTLKDDVSFWSLLLFLVPALLSDLPDHWRNSRCIKGAWCLWPLPFQDYDRDVVILVIRKRHLPGHKLGEEMSV